MASTTKIMIVRHAEKPADVPPPQGVDIDGNADPESLIPQGWQRAGALACLFAPSRGPLQAPELATPQSLFATGVGHHSHSLRPQETIAPTARKLGLAIDTSNLKGDETAVAQAAMACGGVALIAWQHQDIPTIANAIVGNDSTVPQQWPGDRFDLVWVFDLQPGGTYSFTQVPQLLLAGDLPSVIS